MENQTQAMQKQQPTFINMLSAQKEQIKMALPRHITVDRMMRVLLTEFRKNPELAACEPLSVLGSMIQCSQLGLEPGSSLGQAFLIPFYNGKKGYKECQMITGYRGLINLAQRSGDVVSLSAYAVYDNDQFEYVLGSNPRIEHKPTMGEPGNMKCVYAVAKLKNGGEIIEVMSLAQILKVKKGLKKPNPVWESHFDEMARKTVVRRIFKYLPISIEYRDNMAKAIEISDAADNGFSTLDVDLLNGQSIVEAVGVEQAPPADNSKKLMDAIKGTAE